MKNNQKLIEEVLVAQRGVNNLPNESNSQSISSMPQRMYPHLVGKLFFSSLVMFVATNPGVNDWKIIPCDEYSCDKSSVIFTVDPIMDETDCNYLCLYFIFGFYSSKEVKIIQKSYSHIASQSSSLLPISAAMASSLACVRLIKITFNPFVFANMTFRSHQ